ncbi:LOB domain-containing protein 36 [Cardamine amara subsp. amara]|uniref:LOB domain-containing protein 36 n=1 Tax=Cardamine amara subsp. amara TaxID=228776 RepID=A0ABD1B7G4_CARAN
MESCECKCTKECVFVPYLPLNKPEKYASLSKVFKMSKMARLLKDIEPNQRQVYVDSICFEAEARLRDPVWGCVGIIRDLKLQLEILKRELKKKRMALEEIQRSIILRARF